MKLLPHVRAAFERWSAWREANARKPLRQMHSVYLVGVAAPSAAVVALVHPHLITSTHVFMEQLLPLAPWPLSAATGSMLVALWAMFGMLALLAATHGRALGERLFNPPPSA